MSYVPFEPGYRYFIDPNYPKARRTDDRAAPLTDRMEALFRMEPDRWWTSIELSGRFHAKTETIRGAVNLLVERGVAERELPPLRGYQVVPQRWKFRHSDPA